MNGGVAQRQAAADRRLHGLDRAGDKAGSADALEIHVAAEIVAAGPQRRERRLQPRLQFDEAADIGRGALAHRQPNAFQLDGRAALPSASPAARTDRCARGCRGPRRNPTATPNTSAAPARHARSAPSSTSPPQSPRRQRRSSPRPETFFAGAAKTPPRKARPPRRRRPGRPAHDRRRNKTRCRCRTRRAPTAATGRRRLRREPIRAVFR